MKMSYMLVPAAILVAFNAFAKDDAIRIPDGFFQLREIAKPTISCTDAKLTNEISKYADQVAAYNMISKENAMVCILVRKGTMMNVAVHDTDDIVLGALNGVDSEVRYISKFAIKALPGDFPTKTPQRAVNDGARSVTPDSVRDEIKTVRPSVTCALKLDMDAIYTAEDGTLAAYMELTAKLIKKDHCRVMPYGATLFLPERKADDEMLGRHEWCLFMNETGKNCYWISKAAFDLSNGVNERLRG